MRKPCRTALCLSLMVQAHLAKSDETAKIPIFVQFTHTNGIEAHLNIACEIGKVSSFYGSVEPEDKTNLIPRWEIFVKPLSLINDRIEIETVVFERGKRVMAPIVKTILGQSVLVEVADTSTEEILKLEIKTQSEEGLEPVRTLDYAPRFISLDDALTYTSPITEDMTKRDLRTTVSFSKQIEFVGTEEFLHKVKRRLEEVDVESTKPEIEKQ